MAASEIQFEIELRRRWCYWPLYWLVIAAGYVGLIQDAEKAAELVVSKGMKINFIGLRE